MSTKTTFKRIALVAVAALGLGVLSVAPSQAVIGDLTITATAGQAGNTAGTVQDTRTAATLSISGLIGASTDSVSVTFVRKSFPTGNTSVGAHVAFVETTTSTNSSVKQASGSPLTTVANRMKSGNAGYDSTTAFTTGAANSYILTAGTAPSYVGVTLAVLLDTDTANVPTAGSYVYTAQIDKFVVGNSLPAQTQYVDVTITVGALASASLTVVAASSTAYLNASTGTSATADAVVSAVATAASTVHATIPVRTYNANGSPAAESITASISGAGTICSGGVCGNSLVLAGTGETNITVLANGTAGVANIKVATTSVTFADKQVTFYAKAAKTLTAAAYNPTLRVGANSSAIAVTAVDAAGTNWAGAAYIVASAAADALVGGSATTPVACTYSSADKTHFCPVTTIATGTAKFKVIDASTVALATATSNEVTVTVSNASAASVKLSFDKASYAPFEKALITVTVLDKDGKSIQGARYSDALAAGGITSTYAFGSGSDTLTGTVINTAEANGTNVTAGAQTFTVYMPGSGDVKITATGGTSLAAAGQVAVSATASVVNSSVDAATDAANEATDAANAATDAALAAADAADAATAAAQDASDAVAALSATVAKLVASLKAQITSLTNLVIKIQKKVKA